MVGHSRLLCHYKFMKLAYTTTMKRQDSSRERAGFSWRFEIGLAQRFDKNGISYFDKSNRELGAIFNVSKKTITNWRKNDVFPGVEQTILICNELIISVEWLLTGYGQPERAPKPSIDTQWLVELYENMSGDEKMAILNAAFLNNINMLANPSTQQKKSNHQKVLKLVANARDQTKT